MRSERGFTYLGVLLAIAVIGLGVSMASEVWVTTARRQRAEQLEFVGQQYVQAIGSYYESPVDGRRRFPAHTGELLEDRRFPYVRRHLRREYLNPFTGTMDMQPIAAPGGGIQGVQFEWKVEGGSERRSFVYSTVSR